MASWLVSPCVDARLLNYLLNWRPSAQREISTYVELGLKDAEAGKGPGPQEALAVFHLFSQLIFGSNAANPGTKALNLAEEASSPPFWLFVGNGGMDPTVASMNLKS